MFSQHVMCILTWREDGIMYDHIIDKNRYYPLLTTQIMQHGNTENKQTRLEYNVTDKTRPQVFSSLI